MEVPSVAFPEDGKCPLVDEVKQSGEHKMNGHANGINNKSDGHHKHKHKDKDKDRHHDKHKHKDKDRSKEQEKDRERCNSKDKSSKEKESNSEKKHERKEKDHRDKDKDRSKSKDHKSKDKESRDRINDKDYSEKNKENRDKEHKSKEHSSDKYKDGHKPKDEKNSRNESGSSSSKSHSSSSSKEKHQKDKHSSEKYKDKYDSSDKKSNEKDRYNSEKLKHKDRSDADRKDSVKIKSEPLSESPIKKEILDDLRIKSEHIDVKSEFSEDFNDQRNHSSQFSMGSSIKQEYSSCDGDSFNLEIKTEVNCSKSSLSDESEEDIPLSKRASMSAKRKSFDSDDEDVPLSQRKKIKKEDSSKKRKSQLFSDDEDSNRKKKNKVKKEIKQERKTETTSPTKKKKKEEEEQQVWKWWEEEKKDDGVKWKFLEHKGPMFAPPYERLPKEVKFFYNGKEMRLSEDAEEIATFYARLIEHEYTTKEQFNKNFFKDWRKSMTSNEREVITDLSKCDFRPMYEYFVKKSEERKAMSKEEKKKIKEENDEIAKEYGVCVIDGHKEKIGNFRIEPPGLFRGRGEHPKMGMLKKRVLPKDVIINCSKDSKKPVPPEGHKWKEIRHDNTVTWLASWTENVQGQVKYVMLNPSSKLKGEKDWQKYETARKLAKCVDKIRQDYREDWKSKEMRIRQRAVAMYFIDKLALRAGNEKDSEDQADTVGCCSLRVEHIQLFDEKDGKEYVVVFDFLGKDSIRYYNEVPVEKRVFKNLKRFCEKKKGSDDLFDRLNTAVLNKHLNELMEGLTAKVFRTYNASITLQNQLNELTDPNASIPEKILQYNRANRAVAILCNHQRSVPKSHEKSMGNLKQKIDTKREQVADAQKQLKAAKKDAKDGSAQSKIALDKKKKALERLKEQLMKLEVQETDKEENKTIALGTSKLNYLDPRISVAWCKKYGVPIEKVYNKTQRSKFNWAIDMAGPDFVF